MATPNEYTLGFMPGHLGASSLHSVITMLPAPTPSMASPRSSHLASAVLV